MPDCIYFENLCSASVDGTLTRTEKKELEAHLKTCPACREYLEDMRVMRTLWRELDDPAPTALHGSIMAAVQADLAQQMPAEGAAHENVVAIPVEAPVPLHAKKRMRSVILMLGAAAACVGLVVSGGLSGGLSGLVGGTANDAAAAVVAAEAPGAAAQQESMMYAAANEGAASGARMAADVTADAAVEESVAAPAEAKQQAAPELPDLVAERQFAATYLAVGTGELPVIEEAVLLTQENGCSYYSLPNDISVLENVFDVLPGAGYAVTVTDSTTGEGTEANITDTAAAEVLFIVMTEE